MDRFWLFLSFGAYLAILFGIAIWAAKTRTRDISEFYVGGKKMNEWVVALSAVVSGRSSWLILAVSGVAYALGVAAVWLVVGYIVMELFMFLNAGRRLRRYTQTSGDITIPDYFASRLKDAGNIIRIISVLVIFCFIIPYSAAQFNAGAKGFTQVFNMGGMQGFLLTVAIVFIYTTLGGFFAVSYTDVVQSLFMILALVILPIVAIADLGGVGSVLQQVGAQEPKLINPWNIGGLMIFGWIMIGLGSPGNPHILVRYMSIKKASLLKKSALIGTVWNVVMAWGAIFIGLAARAAFPDISALDGDKENAFFALANHYLHPALVGFLMSALLAAIMSTCDSQLLVASSGIARDIFQKIIHKGKEISNRTLILVSRLSIFFLVVLSIILAQFASKEINLLVLLAWGGLGAGFGPQILLSLYWKRLTLAGCAAGMLVGPIVTTLWELLPDHGIFPWMDKMYELVPGFFVGLIVAIIVSLFTTPPKEAAEELERL